MLTQTTTKVYNNQQHPYHIVKTSPWPFLLALSVFCSLICTVIWIHSFNFQYNFLTKAVPFSIAWVLFSFISWLWDVVIEATFEGQHTSAVQKGLRLGFLLFLISEVMFFFSFFWAFFHSSVSPAVWVGTVWPPLGIQTLNAWGIPLLNTIIIISSGVTVTWAHKIMATYRRLPVLYFLRYSARYDILISLAVTLILGLFFTSIQLYEYKHTLFFINDGIYGSAFFLITGFHGFHVLVGTVFLLVCWIRHNSYHFTRDHHLGFEMAIWYWHFVDVIWIFLFIFIYIWGA